MQINSLDNVNTALKRIKQISTDLNEIKLITEKKTMPLQQKINNLHERADKKMNPLADELLDLESKIERFARDGDYETAGTVELTNGSILLRKGKAKVDVLRDVKAVVADLKQKFRKRYIRITEGINKTAILEDEDKLNAEDLRECGINIVRESSFSYKLK